MVATYRNFYVETRQQRENCSIHQQTFSTTQNKCKATTTANQNFDIGTQSVVVPFSWEGRESSLDFLLSYTLSTHLCCATSHIWERDKAAEILRWLSRWRPCDPDHNLLPLLYQVTQPKKGSHLTSRTSHPRLIGWWQVRNILRGKGERGQNAPLYIWSSKFPLILPLGIFFMARIFFFPTKYLKAWERLTATVKWFTREHLENNYFLLPRDLVIVDHKATPSSFPRFFNYPLPGIKRGSHVLSALEF